MREKLMKVLLISAYFPTKPEDPIRAFVRDEALALSKAGVEVHVARWRYAGRLFRKENSVLEGIGLHGLKLFSFASLLWGAISLLRLPIRLFSLKELGRTAVLFSYGRQIAKLVKRYNIGVIHAHFAYPDGFAAYVAQNLTHKPLVVTGWGHDVQSDQKAGYGSLARKDTAFMVKEALINANAIIVGAESHYETVIQLIGKEESNKVHFVPGGIDTAYFNPNVDSDKIREMLGIKADQPIVLFARHLRPIYGIEYLIKAIPYVTRKHPNTVFILLGEGPLLDELKRLAASLNVAKNVMFIGQAPKTEMPFYYAASDLFADPCLMGQGYSALEALACGKPVVGFNIGQIKVENQKDGFLVEPDNVKEFAQKIIWLLDNPKERQKMGEYGRKYVEKHFSLKSRIDRIFDIYEKLASSEDQEQGK